MRALLRHYFVQVLLLRPIFEGSVEAVLRLYEGSVKATLSLYFVQVLLLRATFLKLASVLELPLVRTQVQKLSLYWYISTNTDKLASLLELPLVHTKLCTKLYTLSKLN